MPKTHAVLVEYVDFSFENLWHRRCGGNTLPDNGWSEYAKQVQILHDAAL